MHEEILAERHDLDGKQFRPPKTEAEHQRLVRFYTDQSERAVSIPFSKRGMSPSRVARSLRASASTGAFRSSAPAPSRLQQVPALTLIETLPESMRNTIPEEGLEVTPR